MQLMEYLPERYMDSVETVTFQEAFQPELDLVWQGRNELLLQLDPNTATWGLSLWEEALGLPTDTTRDIEYRRVRVVAKLRGNGTTTVALIKSVAESFSNGEVDVVEFCNEYRLEIRFVGTVGLPPNLDDLADTLDEILPAHLDWKFVIYFRTHGQLAPYTHGELAAFTHHTIREEELTDYGNTDNEL